MQKKTLNLLIATFVVTGFLILGLASKVWYTNIHLDEERTFWASVENALTAGSFTKYGQSELQSQTVNQTQTQSFVGSVAVQNQIEVLSSDGSETIEVETLGFSDADFFRYASLNLRDKEQSDKAQDAVDVWASNGDGEVQLLLESLASSFVLYGNFNHEAKNEIMAKLRDDVYKIDFDTVAKADRDGREVYVYRAEVDLKRFANAFASYVGALGNPDLASSIATAAYSGTSLVDISVDARSRNLVSIVNISAAPVDETIAAQGIITNLEKPESFIKFSELQARLDD